MTRPILVATCFLLFLAPVHGQTPEQKKATVTYLQGLQAADGGFLPAVPSKSSDKETPSSLRSTSSALRALKYFGGDARDRKAAAKFVESCFDKGSGGFADRPGGKPDVATTAVGVMAVVELKLPVETYAVGVVKYLQEHARTFDEVRIGAAGLEAINRPSAAPASWLKIVAEMRNDDGTYGKGKGAARATGSAVVVVLRLGAKADQRDNVIKVLKQGQRPDGGFGKEDGDTSDLETSYRIMRAFMMLKEKPEAPDGLRAFIAKCRNPDGGYGVSPGQPSTVSGTYYAAIVLHWMGEK